MNKIEEIKNLKSLLDQGAITLEEFDALKKKVLADELELKETSETDLSASQENNKLTRKESDKKESTIDSSQLENASEDLILKLEITRKEALKMLDKMDVGFVQQNLIHYSSVGDFKKVEILLIAGLDPNDPFYNKEQKRNHYALIFAASTGNTKMIKLLLSYGADINLEDEYGFTAIFSAIEFGTVAVTKILIERGADINHKTKGKINPLYYAKLKKKSEMIDLLTNAGADEMPVKELESIQRKKWVKNLLIAAAVIGFCWFVGTSIFNASSNPSSSSETSADERAVLHCKWCKKVIIGELHEDISDYTIEPDGIGIIFFNSGTKYGYCSEKCAKNASYAGYGYTQH